MSVPCGKSELLLFEPVTTQISMTRASWMDIHPLNSVDSMGPIQFSIRSSEDYYLDLNDTILYLKVTMIDSDKHVAPVNLLLASLFSDVLLTIGDKIIEGGDHMYAYKSYISTLLNYEKNVKKTHLKAAGFIMDESTKFDSPTNKGHLQRIPPQKSFELMGSINLGFFLQSKYMLPKVNLQLKLNRNKGSFYLMNFGTSKAKLQFDSAILYVRRVAVLPAVIRAHEDGLAQRNAIYPYQRQAITNYTIGKGLVSDTREILVGSESPKLIVVGMVENIAFNGDVKKNPYNFQHFNINYMTLLKNGDSVPGPPLQLDFEKNCYLRAYMSMVQNMEQYQKNESNSISPIDFQGGSALFVFNLTPDLNFGGACAQKFETGNLRMDLKFAKPLPTSINIIIYSIYDAQIEITKDRQAYSW
jgi:hypothetical protein